MKKKNKNEDNKKIFKNKFHMIISFFFAIFTIGFIYLSKLDYSQGISTDNEKIHLEHKEISEDNIFNYVNSTEAYNYIQKSDVIILFGSSSSWVGYYANIINEVAKEINIKEIYYYDIEYDRENKNATYQSIVNYLNTNIYTLDDGTQNIYTPTLLIKKKGNILLFDDTTAIMKGNNNPKEYWNEYNILEKQNTIKSAFEDYLR